MYQTFMNAMSMLGPMMDIKRLNLILGIVAVVILVTSCVAFAYTLVPQGDTNKIVVNGMDFTWDDIENDYDIVSFSVGDLDFEGIKLSDIIENADIQDHENYQYKFTGADGYQKDVDWDDVDTGYIVLEDKKVVFTEQTKSFWVRDLVTIDIVCINC